MTETDLLAPFRQWDATLRQLETLRGADLRMWLMHMSLSMLVVLLGVAFALVAPQDFEAVASGTGAALGIAVYAAVMWKAGKGRPGRAFLAAYGKDLVRELQTHGVPPADLPSLWAHLEAAGSPLPRHVPLSRIATLLEAA